MENKLLIPRVVEGQYDLSGLEFNGSVTAVHEYGSSEFQSKVSMKNMYLDSDLILSGAKFSDEVNFSRSGIGGKAYLDAIYKGFVNFEFLRVEGDCILSGAVFEGGVNFSNLVARDIYFLNTRISDSSVSLEMDEMDIMGKVYLNASTSDDIIAAFAKDKLYALDGIVFGGLSCNSDQLIERVEYARANQN